MRPQIVTILALAVTTLISSAGAFAQTIAQSTPPPPPQRTPIDMPLDNGIFLLLVAGLIFGIYFILQKRKTRNNLD